MWFQSLGIMVYLIAPIFSIILLNIDKEDIFGNRNYTIRKWSSAIGLYIIALLVWFGYFKTENYIGIVELFERLQQSYVFLSSNDKILFFITFLVAIIFPIPTILALTTAFIAHSSIDFGVIAFVFFATVQYFIYLKIDTNFYFYFDMDTLLEWIKVLSPLIISIVKIFF